MALITELKRRNVFRVGAAYGIVAWLLVEVASVLLPTFDAPDWVMKAFSSLVILGFPLALIVAWAFELTPEGIKLEKTVDRADSITHLMGRKLDFAIIGLLAVALIFVVVDNYILEVEPELTEVAAEQAPAEEAVARDKSIAVLPFANMSGDPEQEFFSDGISEELLNTLTAIEGLRVVGRTSSFSFKGKDVDLRTIGESLGVTNILEGSVRQSGGRIRITAQLISAADGFHLWSNSYDRELADIFETQEEIAGEIARALQVKLGFRVAQSVARRSTDNLTAYTWTLRGADLYSRSDVTNLKKAQAFFNKAIDLDPEYVPAYVGHARASIELFGWGRGPAGDLLDDAERSLREAELLDPGSSAIHATRGMVGLYRNDWVGAERAFKKALELDPNDYWAQNAWAEVLCFHVSRPQEAAELYEVLRWREPLDLRIASNYALSLMQTGRVDEAERELQRIIEIDPNYSSGRFYRAVLEAYFQNQIALAISSNARAFELDHQSVYAPLDIVRFFLALGDDASAERWAELGERNSAGNYLGKEMRFQIALYRGDEKSVESISREMAEIVQIFAGGNRYIGEFAWLRLFQRADPNLAMQVYTRIYPELLQDEPQVNAWNHAAAISLAVLLRRSGNDTTADSLLEKSLSVIGETTDRWYPPASATAYLLQGETARALVALREAIDASWRVGWWALEREPIYEPLWDQPEFQAMMAEVKADMATQLAQVREMERNGELEPIPEISAAAQ